MTGSQFTPRVSTVSAVILGLAVVWSGGLIGPAVADESGTAGPSVDPNGVSARFLPAALAERDRESAALRSASLAAAGDIQLGGWNETCIAVNPTDHQNIAYSSLFELRVSTNGGATWKPGVIATVPVGFIANGDPSVAFDGDGRLFVSYLGSPVGRYSQFLGSDIFVAQCDPATGAVLPGYPVNVTEQLGLPATQGGYHDKGWIAIDANPASPYANRIQLIWTRFFTPSSTGTRVLTTHSSDQGHTWSPPVQLGGTGANFKWPVHIAAAPNGDVYAAFHNQPGYSGNAPNGTSGSIDIFRSTDGGATYPQVSQAFPRGMADITFNVQTATGRIPGVRLLAQGGAQPWVLPDPKIAGRIYVVAADDPDNNVSVGDAANVYLARSDDHGVTWATPRRVDSSPGTSYQVLPTAAIDPQTSAITVVYYDNRNGALNARGNYLFDVYAAVSLDGGVTFLPDRRINDVPFDPDAGARCRYDCGPLIAQPWAGPDSKAFAASTSGHVLAYDGLAWTALAASPAPKFGIWGASNDDVFTCGAGGEIDHLVGTIFTQQFTPTSETLFDLDGRSGSDVYAVGGGGTVLHYDGVSWSAMSTGTTEDLHDVWVNPTGSVFAVGAHGTALRYDGASWTQLSVGTTDHMFGLWGASDTDVYATGAPGQLFHYDGTSWTRIETGLNVAVGLWGSSTSDVLLLGFGRLRRFNGTAWQPEDISEDILWKAHGTGNANAFVTGDNAAIAHFDGSVWTVQSNPLTPAAPTMRIGEYIGVASAGGRSFAVWCGNADGPRYLNQQAIFDAFNSDPAAPLAAQLDLDPNVVNLGSHAPWLTAHVEAQDFDVSNVDLTSVRLAGSVPALSKYAVVGDRDSDGIPDVTMRFARDLLDPLLALGANDLHLTGSLFTGERFEGWDEIRVIDPQGTHLSASVSPNPLNPSAVLAFRMGSASNVSVNIFDLRGRLVRTLLAPQFMDAGFHEVRFDGRDANGRMLSSGLYFYRVDAGEESRAGRFAVLK
jgi:hypothetical protein